MALYRCIAKKTSATSLTPSNSSPASIVSGGVYQATANGYAISSYSSMGSSSYPHWLESGDILQSTGEVLALGEDEYGGDILPQNSNPQLLVSGKTISVMGAGYAIESYSNVTPSNSSPVTLYPGSICKMSGTGKAVASVTSITPSNASPVPLGGFKPYIINNGSALEIQGYAIGSYSSKTPSDSNPPSVASGDIVKAGGAGYLVGGILQDTIKTAGASGMWISDLYLRQAGIPNPAATSTETKTWTSDGHYYVMWNLSAGNTTTSYTIKKNGTTISTSGGRGGVEVFSGDTISIAVKSANSSTSAIRYKNINAFKVPLDP